MKTIELDQLALLGPLMAAQLLNAYYSALLLKQQKGVDLTQEIEMETLNDILLKWNKIRMLLEKMPKKPKTSKVYEDQ
jgi:hypothetical protein